MSGADSDLIKFIVRESVTGAVLLLVLWSYRRDYNKIFKMAEDRTKFLQGLLERCIEALNSGSSSNENLVEAIRELIRNGSSALPPRRFKKNREVASEVSEP